MCILFLYVAKELKQANSEGPKLKLVLASNRDEAYARPTKPARFWESDPSILAGQDCVEGGTWLGMTKTGRLSVLLNITSKPPSTKVKSRGELVTGFLRADPTLRGWTYCNNLHQDVALDIRNSYGLFNLLTMDLCSRKTESRTTERVKGVPQPVSGIECSYISNGTSEGPCNISDKEGKYFGFGNSQLEKPYCKVQRGCSKFEEILKPYENTVMNRDVREEIREKIINNCLKDPTRHHPDPELERLVVAAGQPGVAVPQLSSVFVTTDGGKYGTRTHTIIFVDTNDTVNYYEYTMEEPIDANRPNWILSEYEFKVTCAD